MMSHATSPCRGWGGVLGTMLLAGCVSSQPPLAVDQTRERLVAGDPSAMSRIGDAAAAHGDRETAVTFYRRAAELRPDDADAQLSYARALAAAERSTDAAEVLRLAYGRVPANTALADAYGKMLIASHKPREAAAVLGDALRLHPRDAALRIGLGVALDTMCRHAAAQAAYRQALTIEPDSVAARNDLGLSQALSGDTAAAVTTLRPLRAELVASGSPAAVASVDGNLALAYGLMGDADSAALVNRQTLSQDQVVSNARFYDAVRASAAHGCDETAGAPPPSL